MKKHFGFSSRQMTLLKRKNVGNAQLYDFAKRFDPTGNMVKIGMINLLTYIDKKGDFNKKPFFQTKLICQKILENLSDKDKIAVYKYIEEVNEIEQ